MYLSLSTASLVPYPLRTAFRLAAETGYDGVELVCSPELVLRGYGYAASLAREYLPILSVHQSLGHARTLGMARQKVAATIDLALALECPRVVIHGPEAYHWSAPKASCWLEALLAGRERIEGTEMRITIENPGMYHAVDMHNVLAHLPVLIGFARRYDLDITFDTCHAGTAGLDLVAACDLIGDRLTNVHLSDEISPLFDGGGHHLLRMFDALHQLPGDGDLALDGLVAHLAAKGYAGVMTAEVNAYALRAWSPSERRKRLQDTARFVRTAAGETPISTCSVAAT